MLGEIAMREGLIISVLCTALVSCGGGGSSGTTPVNPASDPLDPTGLSLETPPSNGQLPADLLPPA